MKKKKATARSPKVKLSYSKYVIVTNLPLKCPLCGADVNGRHECSSLEKKS